MNFTSKLIIATITASMIMFSGMAQELELNSASGANMMGPSTANYTVTLRENTGGSTFVPYSPTTTVTYKLDNEQRYYTSGGVSRPSTVFGGTNSQGTNAILAPGAQKIFGSLSEFMTTSSNQIATHNEDYTSSPNGTPGTGINVNDNYTVNIFSSVAPFGGNGTSAQDLVNNYYQMADLTLTFNRPVNDPVIHVTDLGAQWFILYFGVEMQLLTPNVSLSVLSNHGTNLSIGTHGGLQKIYNSASSTSSSGVVSGTPTAGHGVNGAMGSVKVSGQNITELKFRLYMHGGTNGYYYATMKANDPYKNAGDAFLVSVSLGTPLKKIYGYVRKDDSPADANVNGTGVNTINGSQLYAYAYGANGLVLAKYAVSSASGYPGYYELNVPAGQNIRVSVSTSDVTIGATAPTALPSDWSHTGEQTDNANQNTGNDGTADGIINLGTVNNDVTFADFGIAQNVTIEGFVRNDNTPTDGNVNGNSGISVLNGSQLYAYAYGTNGLVIEKYTVGNGDPTNGYYKLNVPAGQNINVSVSTSNVNVGDNAPSNIPTTWRNTGEKAGNTQTNGNDGTADGKLNLGTVSNNVTNADFGIAQNVTIEGFVRNDNTPTDGNVNGNSGISVLNGSQLYAYAYGTNGLVIEKYTVGNGDPTNGYYKLNVPAGQNINVSVSISNVNVGDNAPSNIPTTWRNTGEKANNTQSNGNDGTADGKLNLGTVSNNVTNADFGIAQNVTIEGFVRNDNTPTDGNVNGNAGISVLNGSQLYAYAYGTNGLVIEKYTVGNGDPTNGYYKLNVPAGQNISVSVSTANVNVGSNAPSNIPTTWRNTGEKANNTQTNGNDGTADGKLNLGTVSNNVTNADFGIALNQAPVAVNDVSNGNTPGAAVTINPLTNDSDPDGTIPPATVSLVTPGGATGVTTDPQGDVTGFTVPNQGTWAVNPTTGIITFTPQNGFTGSPTPVSYTVKDNNGRPSNPATVTINYTPQVTISGYVRNDNTPTDGNVNGIVGISVLNGSQLYAYAYGTNGIVIAKYTIGNGDPTNGYYSMSVPSGQNITVSVSTSNVNVGDNAPSNIPANWNNTGEQMNNSNQNTGNDGTADGKLNLGTVSSNITFADFGIAANLAPVAVNDVSNSNTPGTAVTINPLTNDSDPDGTIPPATVSLVTPGGATGVTTDPQGDVTGFTVPNQGTWAVNPTTGIITFIPQNGFTGSPTPVNYTVKDNDGTPSNTATVTINYIPMVSIEGYVRNDNTPTDANVNGNTGISLLSGAQLYAYAYGTNGIVIAKDTVGNGDPTNGYYKLNIPAGQNITVSVSTSNVNVGDNAPSNIPANWNNTGEQMNNSNQNTGNDGIADGKLNLGTVSSNITFADFGIAANLAPVAVNDVSNGNTPGTPVTINPLTNDSDPDGTIPPTTVSLVTPGGATGVTTDPQGDVTGFTVPNQGTWAVNPTTGIITFTPQNGFTGSPTPVNYTVKDNDGTPSNTATVTINYIPMVSIEGYVRNDNTPTDANVNGNTGISLLSGAQLYAYAYGTNGIVIAKDTVGNGDPTNGYYKLNIPSGQNITVSVSTSNVNVGDNAPSNIPANWKNTGEKTGNTQTNGNDGTADGKLNLGTVSSNLINADFGIALNQAPVVVNDVSNGNTPGTPVTINPLTNDSDPDGTIPPTTVSLVTPGGATGVTTDPQGDVTGFTIPNQGTWAVNPTTGIITFTPQNGFTGSPTPVSYTVKDNDGRPSNPATVTINYIPMVSIEGYVRNDNTPTDANVNGNTGISLLSGAQLYAYAYGTNGIVIAKDTVGNGDPTNGYYKLNIPSGQNITVSVSTSNVNVGDNAPSNIPANWKNTGEKTGNTQTNGNDGTADGKLNLGTVSSNLINADFGIALNQPPVAVNDESTNNTSGTPVTVNPLSNDSDPDGTLTPSTVSLVTPGGATGVTTDPQGDVTGFTVPNQGTWAVNPTTGIITFTPQVGYTGNPTPVSYTVKDNNGTPSNQATVTVQFLPPGIPDLTPTIEIDNLTFRRGVARDFVVNIFEIANNATQTASPVLLRIPKISGWNITVPGITLSTTDQSGVTTQSDVFGGTDNQNGNWVFRENAFFITVTLKPGVVIPAGGSLQVGFRIAQKAGTAMGTTQNIVPTIGFGSGGEVITNNNSITTTVILVP